MFKKLYSRSVIIIIIIVKIIIDKQINVTTEDLTNCFSVYELPPKCVKNRKNSKHVGMRKMSLISHFLLVPLICV